MWKITLNTSLAEVLQGLKVEYFLESLNGTEFHPSPKSTKSILDVLQVREVMHQT